MPVFNEQAFIREAIEAVLAAPYTKEIIVVDDGSTDATPDILKSFHHPDVKAVFHQKNFGKGRAVQTGFTHAAGDIIVIQDADLEYDPSEYPILLQPILSSGQMWSLALASQVTEPTESFILGIMWATASSLCCLTFSPI